jgi:hypothetical protein
MQTVTRARDVPATFLSRAAATAHFIGGGGNSGGSKFFLSNHLTPTRAHTAHYARMSFSLTLPPLCALAYSSNPALGQLHTAKRTFEQAAQTDRAADHGDRDRALMPPPPPRAPATAGGRRGRRYGARAAATTTTITARQLRVKSLQAITVAAEITTAATVMVVVCPACNIHERDQASPWIVELAAAFVRGERERAYRAFVERRERLTSNEWAYALCLLMRNFAPHFSRLVCARYCAEFGAQMCAEWMHCSFVRAAVQHRCAPAIRELALDALNGDGCAGHHQLNVPRQECCAALACMSLDVLLREPGATARMWHMTFHVAEPYLSESLVLRIVDYCESDSARRCTPPDVVDYILHHWSYQAAWDLAHQLKARNYTSARSLYTVLVAALAEHEAKQKAEEEQRQQLLSREHLSYPSSPSTSSTDDEPRAPPPLLECCQHTTMPIPPPLNLAAVLLQ